MPSFNITIPANAAIFFSFIVKTSCFNLFPTAEIFNWFGLDFLVKQIKNGQPK